MEPTPYGLSALIFIAMLLGFALVSVLLGSLTDRVERLEKKVADRGTELCQTETTE